MRRKLAVRTRIMHHRRALQPNQVSISPYPHVASPQNAARTHPSTRIDPPLRGRDVLRDAARVARPEPDFDARGGALHGVEAATARVECEPATRAARVFDATAGAVRRGDVVVVFARPDAEWGEE